MGRNDVINRGKQAGYKRIKDARGTWVDVPFKQWKREVIINPGGPTALKAIKDKDPDLNKITIPVIRPNDSKVAGTGEPNRIPIPMVDSKPDIGLRGAFTKEALERLLFREASEGKGYKKHIIEQLKEEKKDGDKSKEDK